MVIEEKKAIKNMNEKISKFYKKLPVTQMASK